MKDRFFYRIYDYDWWFIFDREQEYVSDDNIPFSDAENLCYMEESQVVDLLNTQHRQIEELKESNHMLGSNLISKTDYELNLIRQRDGLQQRNDRQAEIIRNLYELMEDKNWEALTAIIEDFKKSDELLEAEFPTDCIEELK